MRLFVQLLMIPISLAALYALLVGLRFGFNLWNPDDPVVTIVWLAIVLSPVWFYGLLYWSKGSRQRTTVLFAVSLGAIILGVGGFLAH